MKKRYKIPLIIINATTFSFLLSGRLLAQLDNRTDIKHYTRPKIILMGFDGLEWSIINDLIDKGEMPALAGLIKNGATADLKMFDKFYPSPALWTTIATGKKPEEHGIMEFITHQFGRYESLLSGTDNRRVKAIWNILDEKGKKAGVINYFATWPPEAINGFIVSNKDKASALTSEDVYPGYLADEIKYISSPCKSDDYDNNDDIFAKEANSINDAICYSSTVTPYLYLKFNKDLDLLMTYTWETDEAQHRFWKFMEPEYFRDPIWGLNPVNVRKYGGFIKGMYRKIDEAVKETIKYGDEDTIIIVCSDHGFMRHDPTPTFLLRDNLDGLLNALGFLSFKNNIKSRGIDFSKTKAFHYEIDTALSSLVIIKLNLKGELPQGIVRKGKECTQVKEKLIEALADLKTIETQQRLFNVVIDLPQDEGGIGISVRNNTDLLKMYNQHIKINGKIYPVSEFYTFFDYSGEHRLNKGVFIICGKNIKKGRLIKDAHILDITPTILYLLGLPVARDMEGKVLLEAINGNFAKKNPIKYIDTYETIKAKTKGNRKDAASGAMQKERLERLRSLGYIQ